MSPGDVRLLQQPPPKEGDGDDDHEPIIISWDTLILAAAQLAAPVRDADMAEVFKKALDAVIEVIDESGIEVTNYEG